MLKVTVDLGAIRHNYRVLQDICPNEMMPVVKADAYGHGIIQVSKALADQGAGAFAVGTVSEGLSLKKSLVGVEIYSLLGPYTDEDYHEVAVSGIIPVIHSWEQLSRMAQHVYSGDRVKVGLKFDTGMGRLGFQPGDAARLCDFFKGSRRLSLEIVSSHLACADGPEYARQVLKQVETFEAVCRRFDQAGLGHKKSLANSPAIFNYPGAWGDIVRPGIALYGGNPFAGTSWAEKGRCLRPAMKVTAPVLSVHSLPKGKGISYGLTFTAPRDMQVAIVGCGYADNYPRFLSNRSWMLFQGQRLPVAGRVCMQMTAVDASFVPGISAGDEVFVLGGDGQGDIDVHELAGWWRTMSYEVFCMLGKNEKIFVDS
ncbi:MAG: alanine racemase [Desulfonatronovibrio sp.]